MKELKFNVWHIKEKRFLEPTELLKFICCEGQQIDELGHAKHGSIVIRIPKGYKLVKSR